MTLFYFKNESVPIQKIYFNFLNTFLQFFPHIFWFLGEILKMKDFYVKIRNLIRLMLLNVFQHFFSLCYLDWVQLWINNWGCWDGNGFFFHIKNVFPINLIFLSLFFLIDWRTCNIPPSLIWVSFPISIFLESCGGKMQQFLLL